MKPDKPKILLIRPQNIYGINNYPSLGLLSVATALHQAGYEPQIFNAAVTSPQKFTWQDYLFVGMTLLTSSCPCAEPMLRQIREDYPQLPVVVGGWHCRLFPEQMAENPLVDYVVSGDGEIATRQLAMFLESGYRPPEKDCPKWPVLNLDALEATRYDLDPDIEHFITSDLTDRLDPLRPRPRRWLPYESSRGCPSQCRFCCNVVAGNQHWRAKNATKTATEMAHIANKYHLDHIKIIDDNFFVDIQRVRQICEMLLMLGAQFTWDAECRADYFRKGFLNDQTLQLCKRAGLVQLTLGLESGSQRTLDLMKKNLSVEQGAYAVSQCDYHKITARCSFIIEVPGETPDDIERTRRFINELRWYSPYFTCGVQTFRPYPRCELTQGLIEKGQWKAPESFEQWADAAVVRQFTAAQSTLPWQVRPIRSERLAAYQSIESGVAFDTHMLKSRWERLVCRIFKRLARWRNRLNWYGLPLDLRLFRRFAAWRRS